MNIVSMDNADLENRFIEFRVHYVSVVTMIAILRSAIGNEADPIEPKDIETTIEMLYEMLEGRVDMFDKLINDFQQKCCKGNSATE